MNAQPEMRSSTYGHLVPGVTIIEVQRLQQLTQRVFQRFDQEWPPPTLQCKAAQAWHASIMYVVISQQRLMYT